MMKRSLSNLIYLEIDDATSERPNPEEVAGPAAGLSVSFESHETHKIPHLLLEVHLIICSTYENKQEHNLPAKTK